MNTVHYEFRRVKYDTIVTINNVVRSKPWAMVYNNVLISIEKYTEQLTEKEFIANE